MRILFVYRGYGPYYSNSVVDFQRYGLEKIGFKVDCFPTRKGGLKGYFDSWRSLYIIIRQHDYDLIHAHYSLSGYIAALASPKPVICSLMGSDVFQQNIWGRSLLKIFSRVGWQSVIVKNKEMKYGLENSVCIPNGVDFENFNEIPKAESQKKVGFDPDFKHIIFVAHQPDLYVKNLVLAQKAISLIQDESICLHTVSDVAFEVLPYFYNAADLLLLTSISEGSPNVIKEAMACNCPIVATDVGDIREVVTGGEGCFLTEFDPKDVAAKIKQALAFNGRTNGREKIRHLDNLRVAKKIINVYKSVLNKISGPQENNLK